MKINWNYIKGSLLIVVMLFLFGFSNHRNTSKKVQSVDVRFEQGENLFMNYEMVNKLLIQNGSHVKNQAKSLIDLNSLEKQVLAHPMVEDATTFLTIDGQLKTSVKQRTPIGRVNINSKSYYIDRQGERMPLSSNHSARVPIITGVLSSESTDDLYKLLMFIKQDEFLQKQIVGIHKSAENDFLLMTRIGSHKINLGRIENLEVKFKNLKTFYNHTMTNKTIENYKMINLKYNNQVVCTKKERNGA
ncbi:MAG: cell division protein FtsQ [Flavobacteriaceae bacterium]|nr:cell division protein FtsQ [Flavobacteriaceae bacterium]